MNALDAAYLAIGALAAPVWMRKTRHGWDERFGKIEPLPARTPELPRVMVHAVSVGEVNATRQLVPLLAEHAEVVLTATTDTGLVRARALYDGAERVWVRRYPLDFSWCVRRFFDAAAPDVIALVELEVWPNFTGIAARRGIPVAVVNGRLSAGSFRGYRRIGALTRGMFRRLRCAAVQDETYAERFRAVGVRDVRITGSMKWDAPGPGANTEAAAKLADELGIDRSKPLIVAGSTAALRKRFVDGGAPAGECEEALLHAATPEGAQLLCAPRRPARFDEAFEELGGAERCNRRSAPEANRDGVDRFLLDTIGELALAYQLADVVVIGRSFGQLAGSDPIEPAGLGAPVIAGPMMRDFESITRAFEGPDAIVRAARDSIGAAIANLLNDSTRREGIATRAAEVIERCRGASWRHAELLIALARER